MSSISRTQGGRQSCRYFFTQKPSHARTKTRLGERVRSGRQACSRARMIVAAHMRDQRERGGVGSERAGTSEPSEACTPTACAQFLPAPNERQAGAVLLQCAADSRRDLMDPLQGCNVLRTSVNLDEHLLSLCPPPSWIGAMGSIVPIDCNGPYAPHS
jgi:hypothetical protein